MNFVSRFSAQPREYWRFISKMKTIIAKSTPAPHNAPNCRHPCLASTLLTCRDQQNQASGSAMLMTLWSTSVMIPEDSLNSYLEEITAYLKNNSLLDPPPPIPIHVVQPGHTPSQDPSDNTNCSYRWSKCPRILGEYLDTSLSFNKQREHPAETKSSSLVRYIMGQQKETMFMTYKAV